MKTKTFDVYERLRREPGAGPPEPFTKVPGRETPETPAAETELKEAEPRLLGRVELAEGVDPALIQARLRAGLFKFEPVEEAAEVTDAGETATPPAKDKTAAKDKPAAK